MRAWSTRWALAALLTVAALPLPAAAAGDEGFLYGRLITRDGTSYEGRLRWDDEEAFWGDFFNSSKEQNPWVDEAPRFARERRRHTVELFGFEIASFHDGDGDDTRQFIARFGDIARLEPHGHDGVTVTLKDGTAFEVEGGSNDVESKVRVWDAKLGEVAVDWRRIRSVVFMPAPLRLAASEPRLFGKVTTRDGQFTGYVQWDQEECVGSDELDGETEDGDVSVRMGTIRSIERRSHDSSAVVLHDGRKLVLEDTNDVDSSNRGIYVEDPRYGRVLIDWKAFERVDFTDGGSGPAYSAYRPGEHLRGMVTTSDGRKLVGRLVYDLDESETTEMLDGNRRDVDYSIPFALIAAVIPRSDSARVILRSGEELLLEDTTDVSDDNAGMLVFEPRQPKPTYVRWDEMERVDFMAPGKG